MHLDNVSTDKAPYGIHPMLKSAATPQEPTPAPITPLQDRIANAEPMVLAFTAENSLSFAMVPAVIELLKVLARDKKVLYPLSMNRTTASYKTRFGVGKKFSEEVIDDMKTNFFSLKMDESPSSNFHRVLTILVSYFLSTMAFTKLFPSGFIFILSRQLLSRRLSNRVV